MSNSPNFWAEWLDTAEIRQNANQVKEEDVKRVQEQGKQAKQAQQAIKKDKDKNAHLSLFLSFLLKNIKNDKLITLLYNAFFKVKHPQSNIVYLRKNINTQIIVGIFVPFYKEEAEKSKVIDLYSSILPQKTMQTVAEYISYLKSLSGLYHDNIPIDKDSLISFITELIMNYMRVYTDKETPERKQLIQLEVAKFLYNK